MVNLPLENEQEAQLLVNLLDVSVRSKGLEAAEAALYFVGKIKALFPKPETTEQTPNKVEETEQKPNKKVKFK